MSDIERDALARLDSWLLAHREVWPLPEEQPLDELEVERLVARALGAQSNAPRKRRRRRIIGGAVVVAVLGGGALGVAALRRTDRSDFPTAAPACRAELRRDADAVVIEPDPDPVARCHEQWAAGAFEESYPGLRPVELVACVGEGRSVDVFPGDESACETLGYAVADVAQTPGDQLLLKVQVRIGTEINADRCLTIEEAKSAALRALDDVRLRAWGVTTTNEEPPLSAWCASAAIRLAEQEINIGYRRRS